MAGAGNIVHEKFTARYAGTVQFISSFIVVELLRDSIRGTIIVLDLLFWKGLSALCAYSTFPVDRRLIFHNVGSWKRASDRWKFTLSGIENLRGFAGWPITSLSETVAYVRNGSYVYNRVVVCEEPLYRLTRSWKIEFTIINAAYDDRI